MCAATHSTQLRRHLRADQVVGQPDGDAENHQHAADHDARTRRNAQQIAADRQIAVDDGLDQQRVAGGQRRGFDRRREAAEHRRRARRTASRAPISRPTARRTPRAARNGCRAAPDDQALAHAPRGDHRRQQDARQDAADEQILDRNLRDDAVEDQRQRRRQQQPERSGGGQQPEREPLAIAVFEERRKQHAAQREDRHARPAGERGEERAEDRADDRGAARNPAEPARGTPAAAVPRRGPRRG